MTTSIVLRGHSKEAPLQNVELGSEEIALSSAFQFNATCTTDHQQSTLWHGEPGKIRIQVTWTLSSWVL